MRRRPQRAFTLMEVVLAIALTAVVVYLLTTAIELYLFNVDASRTRVESAQIARTLLDQIADDLASTRFYAPQAVGGQSGGATGQNGGSPSGDNGGTNANQGGGLSGGAFSGAGGPGGGFGGATGGSPPDGSASSSPTSVQGLFGTDLLLRVDRGASPNWQRASRLVDPQETTPKSAMPTTVRYYLLHAKHLSTERAARHGVTDELNAQSASGLYRETMPTASTPLLSDPLSPNIQPQNGATVELLAPEVVGFTIAYWDGKQLLDEWDSIRAGGLPVGVEICITLAEPSFQSTPDPDEEQRRADGRYSASELVEYRRFVYLPLIEQGRPAQPLLPPAQSEGQENQGGRQDGDNGDDDNGNNGGSNNANNTQFQAN